MPSSSTLRHPHAPRNRSISKTARPGNRHRLLASMPVGLFFDPEREQRAFVISSQSACASASGQE